MTATVWNVNAVAGAPSYSGKMVRQAMSALIGGASAARPLGAQSGVRPGTPSTIVTATSSTWTVTPFSGLIDGEASAVAGPYQFAFDANVTGSVTAADATYARWDTLAVQVSDPAESDGSSTPSIAIVYTAGTPAASPAEAAAPARSFVFARIVVPRSGGGSPSVVWEAPVCASAGGVFIGPSAAQTTALNAIATTADPIYIDDGTGLLRSVGAGFVGATSDTGWVSQTVASGWTTYSSIKTRVVGRKVHLSGVLRPDTGTVASGSTSTVATLPAGVRPASDWHMTPAAWVAGGTPVFGGAVCGLVITASTGVVQLMNGPDGAITGAYVDGLSWFLD